MTVRATVDADNMFQARAINQNLYAWLRRKSDCESRCSPKHRFPRATKPRELRSGELRVYMSTHTIDKLARNFSALPSAAVLR
jgi:hypothetical protein